MKTNWGLVFRVSEGEGSRAGLLERAGEGHWGLQPRVYPSGCPGPPPFLVAGAVFNLI